MQSSGGRGFSKPFFLNWFTTSVWTFFLAPFGAWRFFLWSGRHDRRRCARMARRVRQTLRYAAALVPIYAVSGSTWNYSLAYTSLSANTAIYNGDTIFVFALGIWLLRERFDLRKFLAVLVTTAGVIMVTLGGKDDENERVRQTLAGLLVTVLSAFFFSLYLVVYERLASSEPEAVDLEGDTRATAGGAGEHLTASSSRASVLAPEAENAAPFPARDHNSDVELSSQALAEEMVAHEASVEVVIPHVHGAAVPGHSHHAAGGRTRGEQAPIKSEGTPPVYSSVLIDTPLPPSTAMEGVMESLLFLGVSGLYAALLFPLLFAFHFSGLEPLAWKEIVANRDLIFLTVAGESTYQVFNVLAIFLSSALFASLWSIATTPLSVVLDYVVNGYTLRPLALGGLVLVVGGFVWYAIEEYLNATQRAERPAAPSDGKLVSSSASSATSPQEMTQRAPL